MFPSSTMHTALLCVFLSLAVAQTTADFDGYDSAIVSYIESLIQDPSYISEVQALATLDPSFFESIDEQLTATDLQGELSAFSALPSPFGSEYASLFSSIYNAELSIASQYGVLNGDTGLGAVPTMFTASETDSAFPSITSGATTAGASGAPIFSFNTSGTGPSTESKSAATTTSSQSNTLLSVAPHTSTPTSTSTVLSKAQAASTALPIMAGLAALVAGGFAIGL